VKGHHAVPQFETTTTQQNMVNQYHEGRAGETLTAQVENQYIRQTVERQMRNIPKKNNIYKPTTSHALSKYEQVQEMIRKEKPEKPKNPNAVT
jgi:hypothetical protein